ncbi:HD domain-containing protein [Halalkalibacter sp. APA_J-10(15)]|uniref:HD domain-containing protein n=1 Tax=Halalkalibacter sp. APA_J-10(15) TaxID=2933805 RepID=UPI001FF36F96|nr:HD domain-containing protein [Halalkalibacter sp. APA_J-10(15)]MCK0472599.1 HD domain-containing protein [Halalkalibacter sp. APA_J-10(15)]
MNQDKIIQQTKQWVQSKLDNESSGHDWHHIQRVTTQAVEIAQVEGGNQFIIILAALLHDLIDDKVVESEEEGIKEVTNWLVDQGVPKKEQETIYSIITTISFKGGNNDPVTSLEAQIVQDADRLDAIGAIGIARTFMYAGNKGHLMHDPEAHYRESMTVEEYRQSPSSAIGHFYEKLLKLKELMNTNEGRRRAEERHQYMQQFLSQFYDEWGNEVPF